MVGRYFHPVIGGVENHMLNLASELVGRGHKVRVYASDRGFDGGKLPQHDEIDGVEVRRFPDHASLFGAISRSECDIIHYHLYRSIYVGTAVLAGKISGNPIVLTPHCIYPAFGYMDEFKKALYDKTLGRIVLASVDKTIALTETDKNDIIAIGAAPEKIEIVPNSIRLEDFGGYTPPDLFKNLFQVEKFLLYVGRIDWNKGLEHVIIAMPFIKDMGLKFVIIGEDVGMRERLEKLARELKVEEDIIFTGKVSQETLKSAYAACTLFILPSFYEGLPTTVLEAMAYGKPVIATDTGGTKHIIRHGQDGFLIGYDDPMDIIAKTKEALGSDLEAIARNAKKNVEDNYTWQKSAEKIEQIYEDAIKRRL